jgi:hypothetical protein
MSKTVHTRIFQIIITEKVRNKKDYFQGIMKGLKLLDCQRSLPGLDRVQPCLLMILGQLFFMAFSPCQPVVGNLFSHD